MKKLKDKYLVMRNGIVISLFKNKELVQHLTKKGYMTVWLWENNKRKSVPVHRLVAINHIPNPESKPQVNHINGIKTDNRVENLEWVTNAENCQHAHDLGLVSYNHLHNRKGVNSPVARSVNQLKGGNIINNFDTITEAYIHTNINKGNIQSVCVNKRKTAGGYKWEYVN